MGLTYRSNLDRPLTNTEIDDNFRYFTGSHSITGSLTISGSSFIINNTSGAIITPTSSFNSLTPSFEGVEGQFLFGSGSDGYKIFVWIGGVWRSGSLH